MNDEMVKLVLIRAPAKGCVRACMRAHLVTWMYVRCKLGHANAAAEW